MILSHDASSRYRELKEIHDFLVNGPERENQMECGASLQLRMHVI